MRKKPVSLPRNPFDYIIKKGFTLYGKPFLESAVNERIVRIEVVEESHHRLEILRGASDLRVKVWTESGKKYAIQLDFQKAYFSGIGERFAKYLLSEKQETGVFPLQILVCIEDFAHRFENGAQVGNPGEAPKMVVFFRAVNLSSVPAEWFVVENNVVAIGMGLLCDRSGIGDEALFAMYDRALKSMAGAPNEQTNMDLGGFLISLQLSLDLGRIDRTLFRRYMDATYRDHGREVVHNLIFNNPEIYELFKPDLDSRFKAGKREGKREGKIETARSFYRLGISAEQIFQATGLRPEEYLTDD